MIPESLNLDSLNYSELNEAVSILEELERRENGRKLYTFFPDEGPLRRELYKKHMEFFEAGKQYRERAFMAANRVGKTESAGGYELTLHLTGLYPDWWPGRQFDKPIRAWAAGDTGETVRDIIQLKLFGPPGAWGTGLIPGDSIVDIKRKAGNVPDSIESAWIKNEHGGTSYLKLKSYDQRRKSFQGTEQDVILLDEEPGMGVYSECLLRTMTVNGMIMLTFTPLLGISEVVKLFLEDGRVANGVEI